MAADPGNPNSGAAFYGEDSWSWLCDCGHYQQDECHCSACGGLPPWPCRCDACDWARWLVTLDRVAAEVAERNRVRLERLFDRLMDQ